MPYLKDILDYEFIKEQVDSDPEPKVGKQGEVELTGKQDDYLWVGEPDQKFRLWNSKGLGDTLQSTILVIGTLLAMGLMIFLVFSLFQYADTRTIGNFFTKTNLLIWLAVSAAMILFYLYFDIQDYLFRLGSKYIVRKKGIGFLLGYRLKKEYLIEWKDIGEISFSRLEGRVYIKPKSDKGNTLKTSSPNSVDDGEYPFFEIYNKSKADQLFSVLRKFKRVKIR